MTEIPLHRLIYIPAEQTFGELLLMGAFYSKVKYFKDGIEYIIDDMDNTEFSLMEDY